MSKKNILKDKLKYNGEILLNYKIEYPEFISACRSPVCLDKINKFYREKALAYKEYCETDLFAMAVEQYKYDIENGFPVRIFEALKTYTVTYFGACAVSIYFDRYEYTGGAHGNTLRESQTWNIKNCVTIELSQIVRCPPDYKTYILSEVESQIEKEPEMYFENYHELIAENFNENSFYCTPEGIVFYYQQYDIAPYSSGIREFFIPYSVYVLNPVRLCRVLSGRYL